MAKILYVDADGPRVEAVCALLARKDHHVTAVRSAERAMIRVDREGDYDLVLLHLILPGIDGAELCRWLQRWSLLSGVPRIVFTGPNTHLRLDLREQLPRWLPADLYVHGVEDAARLVVAVEQVLCEA